MKGRSKMTRHLKKAHGTKHRPSRFCAPRLTHTWRHTLSLYPSSKSRKPIFSVTAKNDTTVSVLKLTLILLGTVCAAIAVAALIKRIREKLSSKRHRAEHLCCERCPYAQIEE